MIYNMTVAGKNLYFTYEGVEWELKEAIYIALYRMETDPYDPIKGITLRSAIWGHWDTFVRTLKNMSCFVTCEIIESGFPIDSTVPEMKEVIWK